MINLENTLKKAEKNFTKIVDTEALKDPDYYKKLAEQVRKELDEPSFEGNVRNRRITPYENRY